MLVPPSALPSERREPACYGVCFLATIAAIGLLIAGAIVGYLPSTECNPGTVRTESRSYLYKCGKNICQAYTLVCVGANGGDVGTHPVPPPPATTATGNIILVTGGACAALALVAFVAGSMETEWNRHVRRTSFRDRTRQRGAESFRAVGRSTRRFFPTRDPPPPPPPPPTTVPVAREVTMI